MKKRLLLVPPFLGEFGWELMTWVPYIRNLAERDDYFSEVCVHPTSTFELYKDFATMTPFIGSDKKNCYGRENLIVSALAPESAQLVCNDPTRPRMYKSYGVRDVLSKVVIIHARSLHGDKIGNRNWPEESWNIFCSSLKYNGFNVYAIGTYDGAYCPESAVDKRDLPLRTVIKLLNSAELCIGPSSGPMHLAAMCRCPHLVWTDDRLWNVGGVKATNKKRYEALWNPFNVPVEVFDNEGWQPRIESVINKFEEFYLKMGYK